MEKTKIRALTLTILLAGVPTLHANESDVDIGVVLDGSYQSEARQWGIRDKGFALGHSELMLSSHIDQNFKGQLITVMGSHGGSTEFEIEEAVIETTNLPYGLKVKAGRMLSNVGYTNSKHLHEDAFADRPAVYRAIFGGHYFDDGVQLSWLAPTDMYLALSSEVFSGRGWDVGYSAPAEVGVYTTNLQLGDDVGVSNSWRVGVSTLYNANGVLFAGEHTGEHSHDHSGHDHGSHDHGHSHGPSVTGRWIYGLDATWKWAPQGNYRQQNLRATAELWQVRDRMDSQMEKVLGAKDDATGWYAEVAYQFSPNWTASLRHGEMNAVTGDVHWHNDHYHGEFSDADITESDIALDWHGSHFGRVRAQITHEQAVAQSQTLFTVQYVMSFGAHHAHAF